MGLLDVTLSSAIRFLNGFADGMLRFLGTQLTQTPIEINFSFLLVLYE